MSTITAAEQAGRGGSLLPGDDFDGRTEGGVTPSKDVKWIRLSKESMTMRTCLSRKYQDRC